MSEVSWIKIVTDIFDDEKILLIETLPDADRIIVIWFKLLCLAGKQNNSGVFMMNNCIPYTDEMFAAIFRRPVMTVKLALEAFERYGMIKIINNAVTIPNWEKHQQLDKLEAAREATRKRVAKHREKQKLLASLNAGVTENATVTLQVTAGNADREDKIREDKIREDKIDIMPDADATGKPARHKYGSYKNVLLSDEDMAKLQAEFPQEWETRIERLSEYIASTGKKYKNHLATIRSWARKESAEDAKHVRNNGSNDGSIERGAGWNKIL